MVDVVGNPNEAAIDCVVMLGIALGVSGGRFVPSEPVRRDQMASFIARMMETLGVTLPAPTEQGFSDITGNVHGDRINQLAAVGIAEGVSPVRFETSAPVRCDQMATFLVRAIKSLLAEVMPDQGTAFVDVQGTVHASSVDKLAAAGIAESVGSGTRYQPHGPVRRDQMASLLARSVNHVAQTRSSGPSVAPTARSARFRPPATMICRSGRVPRQISISQTRFELNETWLYRWNPTARQWQVVAQWPPTPAHAYWVHPIVFTNVPPGYYATVVVARNLAGPWFNVRPVAYGTTRNPMDWGTQWGSPWCHVR